MSNEIEKKPSEKPEQNKSAAKKPNQDKTESNKKTNPTKKIAFGSGGKKTFVFPILLFIIFSIAFVYIYKELTQLKQSIGQTTSGNELIIKELNDRISDTTSRFTRMQQQLEQFESKQDVLADSLSQPVEQQIHINEDYALAEIEHLLIIASYNLELDNNIETALSAMEAADARLKGLDNPGTIKAREQLIADINQLRSLNQADLSGTSLFLSALIDDVDDLPLKEGIVIEKVENNNTSSEEHVNSIKHFFILVWQELKSLVVITRDEHVSKARLLPDEAYFIRANIKLELANARFAVFNRDTNNLQASAKHIQTWLNDYFDLSDAAVQNIYDALTEMNKLELMFPKLDISSSLESVRALMRFQNESTNANNEQLVEPLQ